MLRPSLFVVSFALVSAVAFPCVADEHDKQRAARVFDDAVAKFERAEFAEAARAFEEADRAMPSAVAITNAIAAARRASDHLMVARLAERAIARGDALAPARAAIAEAATKLARLVISCEPEGQRREACAMTLDGAVATEGTTWALPGSHRVLAKQGAATAEELVSCAEGAACRAVLRPKTTPVSRAEKRESGLHRAVFFGGLGVTALLAGVTVWSGVDAVAKKQALAKDGVEQAQIDDVLGRARRTDYLLLGAGVAAIATTVVGVWLTDWSSLGAKVTPAGATITASGRFRGP